MVKRLSPETQKLFDTKNRKNITSLRNPSISGAGNMNESQAMNTLRKPGASISPSDIADVRDTPYFKKKLPTKKELRETMVNMGQLNGVHKDIVSEVADNYIDTPFFTKTKKK